MFALLTLNCIRMRARQPTPSAVSAITDVGPLKTYRRLSAVLNLRPEQLGYALGPAEASISP